MVGCFTFDIVATYDRGVRIATSQSYDCFQGENRKATTGPDLLVKSQSPGYRERCGSRTATLNRDLEARERQYLSCLGANRTGYSHRQTVQKRNGRNSVGLTYVMGRVVRPSSQRMGTWVLAQKGLPMASWYYRCAASVRRRIFLTMGLHRSRRDERSWRRPKIWFITIAGQISGARYSGLGL